jgi:hypothetical protein
MTAATTIRTTPEAHVEAAWGIYRERGFQLPEATLRALESFLGYFTVVTREDLQSAQTSRSNIAAGWALDELKDEAPELLTQVGLVQVDQGCQLARTLLSVAFAQLTGATTPKGRASQIAEKILGTLEVSETLYGRIVRAYLEAYGNLSTLDFVGQDGRSVKHAAAAEAKARRALKLKNGRQEAVARGAFRDAKAMVNAAYEELKKAETEPQAA